MPTHRFLRLLVICWVLASTSIGTAMDHNADDAAARLASSTDSTQTPHISPQRAATAPGQSGIAEPRPKPATGKNTPPLPATTLEALVRQVWPGDDEAVLRVISCESNLNPDAIGKAGEVGLMQLSPVHKRWLGSRWELLFDPVENLKAGWELYQRSGAMAWTCARSLGITSFG